jgi:two-component system, cell cycle response regulator DivK
MGKRQHIRLHFTAAEEMSMQRKILVIEDNEQNMYLVTFILEKYGYQVIQGRNGNEGLAHVRQQIPDLILLDIQLPVMDGYTVALELRKNEALVNVPIIAVTSYAMPGDRERAMVVGCTGYIEKPIDPDTFIIQIEQYLQA